MTNLIRATVVSLAVAGLVLVVAGCAPESAPTDGDMGDMGDDVAAEEAVGSSEGVDIAFVMVPDPPVAGENTFEATVTDADGQPVTDAEVSARFFMAAMPAMNMPEMQNTTTLSHQGGGRYQGTGQVVMAGAWTVTVTATRGDAEIGRRELTVTAAP